MPESIIDIPMGIALQCIAMDHKEVRMCKVEHPDERYSEWYVRESLNSYLTPCIYCGIPCDSIDHVPPRYMRAQLSSLDLIAMHEQEVPSCRDCNAVLGRRPLITITERRKYVKESLKRRYAKYLRIPDWPDSKLAELGDSLRKMIQRNLAIRDDIRMRIAWRSFYERVKQESV